jgi:aspartyl-tRNA(Asn)/glutamyl-tRNA(Gln) amidotransferase subunit B
MEKTRRKVKIGLEIHIQLTILNTKLFCSCKSGYRGKPPNSLICPVCLGLPGSLPVLNKKAIRYSLMAALALKCKISPSMFFFRKNYFYPDLPKNFQITQYDKAGGVPLATDGHLYIEKQNKRRKIHISRVHIEEDPGRLVYLGSIDQSPYTLVDYNRSGVALLETVTEPDIKSAKEARLFLQKLRSIFEHLGIFDGNLQGAMRCDANISLEGEKRIEVKNISSFKEVERALNFEITRQKTLLGKKGAIKRETRHWDENRRITISLRTKEEEHDYRYFPEPNLVPIRIEEKYLEEIKLEMPELPDDRMNRFILDYNIPRYDSGVLVSSKALADFFEESVKLYNKPKNISNWIMTDLLRHLYKNNLELQESKITPEKLVEMIQLIEAEVISGKIAKIILPEIIVTGKTAKVIVKTNKLIKITDLDFLNKEISKVFTENQKAVNDALKDEKTIHFLIGKIMKKTKGRADPKITREIVRSRLDIIREKKNL